MATLLKLLLVLGAICLSYGVQHSERHFESFYPSVPQVHLVDALKESHTLSNYVPSISSEDTELIALDLAEQLLGFKTNHIIKNSYVTVHNNVRHVYLKQIADDGREIFNADLNINIKNKKVLNMGHSFYRGSTRVVSGDLSSIETISILSAFLKMEASENLQIVSTPKGIDMAHKISGVKGAVSNANVRAGYVQVEEGKKIEPVWNIEIEMDDHWFDCFVSMVSGEVISVFDWAHDVNSFNIYPVGVNDPSDGERTVVFGPAVLNASPLGWNSQGNGSSFNVTIGNNVYAQSNPTGSTSTTTWINNPRPKGGATNDYNFPINFNQEPVSYINASVTNLFAWNNYIHDIFYQYGFDEVSGNFQENNFNRGGKGGDAVQANAQDGAGKNNANMATPVDGQRPKMRMYTWDATVPNRDGDFDNGIIVHEYAHGISTRLTGGPANSNCLGSGEAGGMGEGWGDFFAVVLRQRPTYNRLTVFPMGDYASNKPNGIRRYPYTTDMKIDPETYAFINGVNYTGVHAKGEVWCGILLETYWNFVDQYGFSSNVYTGEGGNNKILKNVVDGMKLQPCNPNFVSARDAILAADKANYNNANYCLLWQGFAKRGLGVNAVGTKTGVTQVKEDFTLPTECQ